jgi:hypothetical protein
MTISDFDILGYSGLKEWGGRIYEEFHRRLQGPYAAKVYREMTDNSDTIGAVLYIIDTLVRQVDWRVEPSVEGNQEAVEWASFVEGCLEDMSMTFSDFVSEVMSFLSYGWAFFEIVYKVRGGQTKDPKTRSKYDDNKIGWRKLALRAQDTLDYWEIDEEDSGIRGMYQATEDGKTAYIPIEKAILFRTKTYKNNPEGRSILRNAVVSWFFLKRIQEIEAIGIERDLAGLPVMKVPVELLMSNATDSQKSLRSQLEKMLAEIKRDERGYLIIPHDMTKEGKPSQYNFSLLSSGGTHQVDTDKTKTYYKLGMLQSMAAQFIQLGASNVGSYALASSQTNLFSMALGAYLDVITETFNMFGINRLMQLNRVDPELWPILVHGDIETPDLDNLGKYITSLAMTGMLPVDDSIRNKLLEIANLPVPNIEEGSDVAVTNNKAPLRTINAVKE